MKKFNKKHLYWMIPTLVIAIVMLVLECLPNGVEMVFKWPIDIDAGIFGSTTEYYPYFSGMPYGYGNIAPVFIGIFTLAVIILCIVNIFIDKIGIDIAIVVLNALKLICSSVEFIFSRTAINWAVFAISIVFTIYSSVELAFKVKSKKSTVSPADTTTDAQSE